jgi:hypothetical protein
MTAVLTDSVVSTTGPQVGWQPIETAPRDGTPVWLYCESGQIAICEFRRKWSWKYMRWEEWWHAIFPPKTSEGAVSLWQPLPTPPATAGRETDAETHPGTVSHEPSPTDTQG